MADIDPKRPYRQRQHACSGMLYCLAILDLSSFQCLVSVVACGIALLKARARSRGISQSLYNTTIRFTNHPNEGTYNGN